MVNQHEYDETRHTVLHDVEGLDYSVPQDDDTAAEIGIPTTPENVERHIASAKQVAANMGHVATPQMVETDADRQAWIDSFHLTHPASEGPLIYASAEQRAITSDHVAAAKAQIRPTSFGQRRV